jgi:hypothetical protein
VVPASDGCAHCWDKPLGSAGGDSTMICHGCEHLRGTTCYHPANPRPVKVDPDCGDPCRLDIQAWGVVEDHADETVELNEGKRHQSWSVEDDEFLIAHPHWSSYGLAQVLDRSPQAIRVRRSLLKRRHKMDVGFRKPWTYREDAFILSHSHMSAEAIGKALGRTRDSITNRRRTLRQKTAAKTA